MQAEIWREGGITSKSYFVYPAKTKPEAALKDAATVKKCKASTLKAVIGWVYKDELYIGVDAPAKKAVRKTVVIKK